MEYWIVMLRISASVGLSGGHSSPALETQEAATGSLPIAITTSSPLTTLPKTVYCPLSCVLFTRLMKNCEEPLSRLEPLARPRYPTSLTYPSATVVELASRGGDVQLQHLDAPLLLRRLSAGPDDLKPRPASREAQSFPNPEVAPVTRTTLPQAIAFILST